MTKYRKGFKSEANGYSREFRAELGLVARDPLSPWRLAEHLAIPLSPLSSYKRTCAEEVRFLCGEGQEEFSAVTLPAGTRRFIIFNDSHHQHRQASDIAHELAHIVLGHRLRPVFSSNGDRTYDSDAEAEAHWLGPALLVSEEAALHIERSLTMDEAVRQYQVSESLIRMRLNVTGAGRRVRRARRARRAYRQ